MRADRKARHYTGNISEINVGKEPYYGTREVDGGPGSANSAGRTNYGEAASIESRKKEVEQARRIVRKMREKKAEARKRRAEAAWPKAGKRKALDLPDDWEGMQREITEANRRFQRGEITERECNALREEAIRKRRK